eukprot:TRINITY_DN27808_c0_g1_i1.p1 TRINITY_DN27808_c0_g1~~TRINITY_DN27808_c0_g1_i1.p1  ORF type:complete len:417 (-),score=93.87 TRINITY_DN27808_c0_g1_i1:37-1287(-)
MEQRSTRCTSTWPSLTVLRLVWIAAAALPGAFAVQSAPLTQGWRPDDGAGIDVLGNVLVLRRTRKRNASSEKQALTSGASLLGRAAASAVSAAGPAAGANASAWLHGQNAASAAARPAAATEARAERRPRNVTPERSATESGRHGRVADSPPRIDRVKPLPSSSAASQNASSPPALVVLSAAVEAEDGVGIGNDVKSILMTLWDRIPLLVKIFMAVMPLALLGGYCLFYAFWVKATRPPTLRKALVQLQLAEEYASKVKGMITKDPLPSSAAASGGGLSSFFGGGGESRTMGETCYTLAVPGKPTTAPCETEADAEVRSADWRRNGMIGWWKTAMDSEKWIKKGEPAPLDFIDLMGITNVVQLSDVEVLVTHVNRRTGAHKDLTFVFQKDKVAKVWLENLELLVMKLKVLQQIAGR